MIAIFSLVLGFCLAVVALTISLRRRRRLRPYWGKHVFSELNYFDRLDTTSDRTVYGDSSIDVAKEQDPIIEQTSKHGDVLSSVIGTPYNAGDTLRLEAVKWSTFQPALPSHFEVTVLQVIEPITMSVVMKVLLREPSGCDKVAILKLYDRRYALGVRKEWYGKIPPWDPAREREYRKAVDCGQLAAYMQWLDAGEPDEHGEDSDDLIGNLTAQDEGDIYRRCTLSYAQESSVYERLEGLQGEDIPRLFATVRLDRTSIYPPIPTDNNAATYLDVPGLLMEYVEGFPIHDIADHTPEELWQPIVDDAIDVINHITDHDVVNQDVKTRNTLVRKADNLSGYKVILLDFGHARLRGQDESDLEWREAKYNADEEGAIGQVMESILRKIKPGVVKEKEKYGARNYRWLGAHTFESPRAYQEWLLKNPDMALEGIAEDALRKFAAEGSLICPLEDFKSNLTRN
ncbi:MAG: hypothetical protein M1835_001400 [Candelina submexicana]|nr:MAG: hypothetical protein M1835_001400 [Candelina submexicana]